MASARFKLNGTNNTSLANPLSPDAGSGYRIIPGGSTIQYKTAQAYEGTSSINGDGTEYVFFDNGAGSYIADGTNTYVDFFFKPTSLPGSDVLLVGAVFMNITGLYLASDGRVKFKDSGGTTRGQSTSGLISAGNWYRVRAMYASAGSQGLSSVYVWTTNLTTDDPVAASATSVSATAALNEGYLVLGATANVYVDDVVIQPTADGNPTHVSATSHTADATRSTTVAITAAANLSTTAAATRSTTATVTAAALVDRVASASVSTTGTLTAAATRETFGAASVATTVSITASADVTPAAGNVTGDAVLSVTDTITAAATLTGVAAAAVSETVTITAEATVERFAAASLSITGTLTATATIPGQVPTTQGFMRGVEAASATMRPASGVGSVPRIVALVGLDTATMTALLSTSVTPSPLGVPIFQGGSVSPAAAGLIAAGLPYVWFAGDGTVYKETGS